MSDEPPCGSVIRAFKQLFHPQVDFFAHLSCDFEVTCEQIVSVRVKTLSHTNLVASRHIKREKSSLPVDVHRSETLMLNPLNPKMEI